MTHLQGLWDTLSGGLGAGSLLVAVGWVPSAGVEPRKLLQTWRGMLLRQHHGVLCDCGEVRLFLWASIFLSAKWKGLDLISESLFDLGHSLWVTGCWTVGRFLNKVPWQSLSQKLGSFNLCSHTSRDEELTTSQFLFFFK